MQNLLWIFFKILYNDNMTNILKVTDQASIQLQKIISKAPSGTIGVVVGVDKSGCNGYSYKLDFANKTDVKNLEFVEQNNVKIFIDPKATMFLIGSEMDYSSDKLSSRFIFKNPNEKSTCGCGESFNI
jgi:iron-sulfur cluster assembly protein